jgi:NAD(P)-dependent dehydrogenase (short-subunit alcohol dehydrogenase family)
VDLEGKVAVVTGGGSGIGAALARACAAEGMHVFVADVDQGRAQEVAASVTGDSVAVRVDVSDEASVMALADEVARSSGCVDVLFNNAGVSPIGRVSECTDADWRAVFDVNVFGVANCLRHFVPRMIERGSGGRIVNTASGAAFRGEALQGPYCATKHAVLAISDSLRAELAPHGIGVSVFFPGAVATNIASSLVRPSVRDDLPSFNADLEDFMAGIDELGLTLMEPDEVAALVLAGVQRDADHIVIDPAHRAVLVARTDAILDAFEQLAG